MGKKILVVDDDPDIASLLQSTLEYAGYEIRLYEGGEDVLVCLNEYKPDLLITDVMLPGIDGYSLVTLLADDEILRNLPVIILSALTPSRNMFGNIPQVKAFLPKPFKAEDLAAAVKSALAGK